jgi:hypothetical protein
MYIWPKGEVAKNYNSEFKMKGEREVDRWVKKQRKQTLIGINLSLLLLVTSRATFVNSLIWSSQQRNMPAARTRTDERKRNPGRRRYQVRSGSQ